MPSAVGKRVRTNRPTERTAVNTVATLFEANGLLFQPVALENDIGRDAYVELVVDGRAHGEMVALQIKGGASYRGPGDDHHIPCDETDISIWARSPMPVFGVVHDPDAGTLHWVNLTHWARTLNSETLPSHCPVPANHPLDDAAIEGWIRRARVCSAASTSDALLALLSDDSGEQYAAVLDCAALARDDPRPLLLLRRLLGDLQAPAFRAALRVLALCTPHPDIFWSESNSFGDLARKRVRIELCWSLAEAERMLACADGEEWQRGDFGEDLLMLFLADPDRERLLERVIGATTNPEVVWHAALICLYLAEEEGPAVFDRILRSSPTLACHPLVGEFAVSLTEFGYVEIF